MQALLTIARAIDRFTEFVGKSVMWLILVAVLVSAINAIIRKLFNMSSNAWLELQWYLYGAAFMLAAANTLSRNEHIRIDIFYASRSRKTQNWIDLVGHLFFLLPFVALMSWMLVPYMLDAIRTGQISTNAGGLLIWPARAILLAGFVLLLLQALAEIVKKIAVIQGLIEDPHSFVTAQEAAERESKAMAEALLTAGKDKA